ncbi:MAG: hypothetical protein JWL97_3818 [Gemmatimonadales bacterium]|jgi:hypothetical protein|nr:hypothetical protein [Gemmatimonadales bacterium]
MHLQLAFRMSAIFMLRQLDKFLDGGRIFISRWMLEAVLDHVWSLGGRRCALWLPSALPSALPSKGPAASSGLVGSPQRASDWSSALSSVGCMATVIGSLTLRRPSGQTSGSARRGRMPGGWPDESPGGPRQRVAFKNVQKVLIRRRTVCVSAGDRD